MPLIPENEALALSRGIDSMTPENQARAADVLRRYRDQQKEFGLPDFPSMNEERQKSDERFYSLFDDLKNVDAHSPSFATGLRLSVNPDDDRARVANMTFLARQYGKNTNEIDSAYHFFKDDFAQKTGQKVGLADREFYTHASGLVKQQKAAREVRSRSLDAGFRAAIEGGGSVERLAAVRSSAESNTDNEVDSRAFLEAYQEADKVMSKHSAFVREYASAISSYMDGGEVNLEPMNERLLDLPGGERRIVLAALRMEADKAGEKVKGSKGGKFDLFAGKFLQQTGEAAGRLAKSAALDQRRIERLISAIPETGEVLSAVDVKTPEDARRYVRDSLSRSDVAESSAMAAGPGGFGAMPVYDDSVKPTTLSGDAQKLIQDAKEREFKRLRVANEIRSIGEAADPIPNVFASTIGTSGAALALMAGTRGLAAPAVASAYSNVEYNELSLKYPQMSSGDKTLIASISGSAQAALDFVGFKALGKLPGIKSLLAQPLTKQLVGRAVAAGALSFATENTVEAAQDIATPALMLALKSDVPGFDWEAEKRDFWNGRADVAIGLLPLTLLGIGASTVNEYRGAKQLLASHDWLGRAGVVEADRIAVIEAAQNGDVQKSQDLLREAWGRRDSAVAAEFQAQAETQSEERRMAVSELERIGEMPTIRKDGDGYTVSIGETSTRFKSWDDARDVAQASMNDLERAQTELVVSIADSFMGGTPSFMKGESVEFSPGSETMAAKIARGDISFESAFEAAIAGGVVKGVTLAESRAISAEVFGPNPSERAMQFRQEVEKIAVLGSNKVEGGESKSRVFGKGNERAFLTAVEEITEGRWKAGLERRAFTKEQGIRWVQLAEAATGETFLEGSTWDEISTSTETAPRALTEAISRIVTADVLGRMKDGKRVGAGSISRGLDLSDREQSALAAILGAFRKLFRSILETASKLSKARKEGKLGAEYDTLFDALTGGTSQLEHEAGAANEADAIANEAVDTSGYSPETPGPNGETFSMDRAGAGATPADASKVVQMPDGARLVGPTTFSLAARDTEYMAAVEAGDMEKAQRMVDEAARKAGFNVRGYHGTNANAYSDSDFTVFNTQGERGASFFSSKPEEAKNYGEKVYNVALAMVNPLVIDANGGSWTDLTEARVLSTPTDALIQKRQKFADESIQMLRDLGISVDESSPLRPIETVEDLSASGVDTDALAKFARKYGYDGVVFRNVKDSPTSGMYANEPQDTFAVFSPSQIKSADPVTRDDSGNVIPLSQRFNPADDRITYSLRPGDFAARMEAKFALFSAKPELRMAVAQVAKERAMRLGAEWIEKAAVLRTSASIQKEQAFREADSFDRRVNDYLESLTPSARQTLEFEPSALENDPLVSAMLDEGKLMSRSTAIKNGVQNLDEYDGAPWLPPAWYSKGAGITPGKMAKALHDGPLDQGGPLKGDSAQALWGELAEIIASTRKNKAAHREAVQAYKDAQKAARTDAKMEAEAWANQARKTAGSAKAQREMLKAALRTLDGILAAAPPEVRAKVGGYVNLAGLATDEAMLAEIEKRIEKLNRELEKWLKKEAVREIEKLLKKGRPDMEAGKKGKGRDADMHALFAAAEAASVMDALAVAGRLADLDARIASGELTPEQEVLAMKERGIVELIGDLKSADAGRAYAAMDALKDVYTGGWLKWKLAEIERKERRAGMRQGFIEATGKKGIQTERDAAEKFSETLLGKAKGAALSLSSFHEVMAYAFGETSGQTISLVDAERAASGRYEDANQKLGDEVESFFASMAGSTLKGEKLRYSLAQKTIKTAKGEYSQLQAIQALLMWNQEDGRRHMEGTRNENNEVTSSWSYDQAWIDEVEAALTPEARRVMGFISAKYSAEWSTLNPLYRARYGVNLPQHDAYARITVAPAQAKAGEMIDPISGGAVSGSGILTPGSLRTRSRSAIAEPKFHDALQVLLAHSKQMEYWRSYYDLASEMSAVLGNNNVMNSVEAKGGKAAREAVKKWIDAVAMGGFRDSSASLEMSEILQRMSGRAATVGLVGRFSTLLVQSTQIAAASVKMPVGSYIVGMSKLLTGNLGWKDAIQSDFIQRRYKSAPPIVRQAMDHLSKQSKPNAIKWSSNKLGQLISGADAFFTSGTYALLLDYHRKTGAAMGLTGAELETHAHTEAERATEQVAQPTRMTARSLMEVTSTNPLAKVSWAYASEARQKIALAAWAAANAKNDPARFAKTAFLVFGVGGLMTQVLKNAWREMKGDDDEKKWSIERLTVSALTGPLHGIPGVSELRGDGGMFSGLIWAKPAVESILSGDFDLRDVDTVISAMGMFNDNAAAVSSMSHLGLDAAKLVENLAD